LSLIRTKEDVDTLYSTRCVKPGTLLTAELSSHEITRTHSVARNAIPLHKYVAHINGCDRIITLGTLSQQESMGTAVDTVREYNVNLAILIGKAKSNGGEAISVQACETSGIPHCLQF
jgi:hypothetical protein